MTNIEKTLAEIAEYQKIFQQNLIVSQQNQAKIDVQLAKTDVQLAKTDAQLAKTDAQLAATEARFATQNAKSELKLKETKEMLSNIGFNLVAAAEEFFYYALREEKKFAGMIFDNIQFNVKSKIKKLQGEFDIVLYNGDSIGLIEIKHRVHENDLQDLIHKKVANFKALFSDYADYKFYLGIGGFTVSEHVEDAAHENGIAILRQKGDLVEILDNNLKVY